MRNKLLLSAAVAITTLFGARASAQAVLDQTVEATAEITQLLELTISGDGVVECGTVTAAIPLDCGPDKGSATVHVLANVAWELTMEDLGGAGPNKVLMNAPTGRFGNFVVNLAFSTPTSEGTGPGAGTATPGADVDIAPDNDPGTRNIVGISGGDDVEILDTHDDFGTYEGEFIVTLLPDV